MQEATLYNPGDIVRCVDPTGLGNLKRGATYIVDSPCLADGGFVELVGIFGGWNASRFELYKAAPLPVIEVPQEVTPELVFYKAGDRVRCTKPFKGTVNNVVKGAVYTVRNVVTLPDGAHCLEFQGVGGRWADYRFEPAPVTVAVAYQPASITMQQLREDQFDREVAAVTVAGRKDDSGKLDMTLFDDMPRALEAVAEVMQWAITKKQPVPYVRGSWLGVEADRYRAAIKRHDSSACHQATMVLSGCTPPQPPRFQRDAETKLLHLAHEACSALFALELTIREMESNADKAKQPD